jgi:ribosomal protein S17
MAHTLIGTVTSDKRDKTITVSIVSRETHPLYRKQYSKTRKYTAHDAKNEAHVGDRVQIAISMTCPKVPIDNPEQEETYYSSSNVLDFEAPVPVQKTEITQEEKDNIAALMERLGL